MTYLQHFLPSKIVCVGRNYAAHANELGNEVPSSPLLFLKPISSINLTDEINIADITQNNELGELHYECELCVRLCKPLKNATRAEALHAVDAITLGLDLTLRDQQRLLKSKSQPWERAKAFDGACVLGDWVPVGKVASLEALDYRLLLNNETRQTGDTSLMIFPIVDLLVDISQQFTLEIGDIVMTGTPEGVGKLLPEDSVDMQLRTKDGIVSWVKKVV